MTDQTTKPRRKRNPAWQDATRAKRQANRQAPLNEVAQALGFDSWRKFETAVKNGMMIAIVQAEPDEDA